MCAKPKMSGQNSSDGRHSGDGASLTESVIGLPGVQRISIIDPEGCFLLIKFGTIMDAMIAMFKTARQLLIFRTFELVEHV